jgi:hypothetical protein
MKRNYSLFRIALVLATGCAFLLPVSAPAPTVQLTITQFYLGFSQSFGDPNQLGPVDLNIPTQTQDGAWEGVITILGNTYTIKGKVDNNGNLDFTSGRAGPIKGTGKWQDLTRGGALLLATYKLSSGEQGKIELLRKFAQPPPDQDTPPDIAGSWRGTFESSLSLMRGTVEWDVQQDLTETGASGTGFTGQERIMSTPAIQLYQFAGAIDGQGNFVRIGVSSQGFLIEGGKFESRVLNGHSVRADGLLLDVILAPSL